MTSKMNINEIEDSSGLGLKEQHIHNIFCLSKTNSSDFIYNHSKQIHRILDAYCGDSHAKKPPLLVIGAQWTGKSSLLSNFITLRRNKKAEIPTISRFPQDEFIFWYSVGSTRISCYEVNLIHRLFCDLNEYFDLSREVPALSERLRWVLPRLLQTASRKGRMIIIVVDGVDRLVSDDQNESVLSWVPLEPLSNVKIILSATVPSDSLLFQAVAKENIGGVDIDTSRAPPSEACSPDNWPRLGKSVGSSKALVDAFEYEGIQRSGGTKLLRLLERRPLQVLRLRQLDKKQSERLLVAFIKKTIALESPSSGVEVTVLFDETNRDLKISQSPIQAKSDRNALDTSRSKTESSRIKGFLLFPCHLQALLSNRLSSNAYYIRLVLVFTSIFCRLRGCPIWPLWSRLTSAEDIPSLLDTVFQFIESPALTQSTRETEEGDLKLVHECGGLRTLIEVYPWNPSLQQLTDAFQARSEGAITSHNGAAISTNTAVMTTVPMLARQTNLGESYNDGLQDFLRRASSVRVGTARNSLLASTNHVSDFILFSYICEV